jgi:maltooligosyltrehalose trehalohydrolase
MTAGFRLRMGAEVLSGGGVEFRVWAPRASSMAVRIEGAREPLSPMTRGDDGVFEARVPSARAGDDYFYVIDGDRARPDPVSRWQPRGVHGPSRVVDPRTFASRDIAFRAPELRDLVIYELHVGTFTPEGTFDAAARKLRYLRELGVNAIELMPVAEFPGGRNWGYDGVYPYAPQSTYGGPEGLSRLVAACHREGIAVILDVVYNHLGPEGNYLGAYGPYFTDRYHTPWGSALNFDGPDSDLVRDYFVDNALTWLNEHRVDGLRLDAIHGIFDFGARHVLEEIASAAHEEAARAGRRAILIAESDLNDPRVITPAERGGQGLDAQWSDDFHHALHARLAGARHGYFADFGSVANLQKALTDGFVYDGAHSAFRRRKHGRSSVGCSGHQLVVYTQNHDQIANGSGGSRHGTLLSPAAARLAAVALLTAPNVPMLFMGQEYGETAPFSYFTSHGDPGLADAVREGRRAEFAGFGWEHALDDPQDVATFEQSRLDWTKPSRAPHEQTLLLYRDLLRLRRDNPCLRNGQKDLLSVEANEERAFMVVQRWDPSGSTALVLLNLSPRPQPLPILGAAGPRWELALYTADPRYGGDGPAPPPLLDSDDGATPHVACPGSSAIVYLGSPAR